MVLDNNNYLVYAMHHYQVPSCPTFEQFEEDMKIFLHIKRAINKKIVNTRLILNHIIIAFNCFGEGALNLLFFRVGKEQWSTLATFLLFINRMPDVVPYHPIRLSDLTLNGQVIKDLRAL